MRGFLLVILAVVAFAGSAVAQMSRSAPGHITPTSATSGCIGAATTAVCAAETLLACLARGDASLCRAVGAVPPARRVENAGRIQIDYVVVRVSVIRPEDITDDTRDLDWYKPGYTLIEMDRRACPAEQSHCDSDDWDDLQVYLKRGADAERPWQVVTWRSETEPDLAPEIPDSFRGPPPEEDDTPPGP